MLVRVTRFIVAVAIVLAIVTPAFAHTRPTSFESELDLRAAAEPAPREQSLPFFSIAAFDDLARIDLPPPPPLSDRLQARLDAITSGQARARTSLPVFTVSAELASGLLASGEENNFSEDRELGLKTRWGVVFQALPFHEPATGLVFARARWYDRTTGAFLSPDPLGYVDSSNLYAFCGGDPVNCSDPTGEWGLKDAWETTKSIAGAVVGVVESAGEAVYNLNPVVSTLNKAKDTYARSKRVASAYKKGGARAAAAQYASEVKNYTGSVVKSLPIVNTVIQASEVPAAYDTGSFEGGRQVGRATFSLAGDVTLIYGGFKGMQQARAAAAGPSAAPQPRASAKPQWLQDVEAGTNYNKARAFDYPYREVYVEKPTGSGYYRLDAYDPLGGEIVSRKMTQFSRISESTGIAYVNELAAKYPAGAKIARVPSSGPLAGQSLRGQLILEVPMQGAAIPDGVLKAARARGVVIRDVFGNVY